MSTPAKPSAPSFGAEDLRLPDDLRAPLLAHLKALKERYLSRGWGGRVGFGLRPALVVIDLAPFWLKPQAQIGSNLDTVVDAVCQVLRAARAARVPIFFTTSLSRAASWAHHALNSSASM